MTADDMARPLNPSAHVDAIVTLAEEIVRIAPECTEKAMKIIEFARELGENEPDRGAIADAIESQMIDDELSEPQIRSVTSAVVRSVRGPG
jgi:hypothetical protein